MLSGLVSVAIAEWIRQQANDRGYTSADVLGEWEAPGSNRGVEDLADAMDPGVATVIRTWIGGAA